MQISARNINYLYMSERLPFSILTFDALQGEFVDEQISGVYATDAETKLEADYLLEDLGLESGLSEKEADPTYAVYLVGPSGDRIFYKRG